MALLCEITRCASSTITRHIQICFSRMVMTQNDLLCVVYSGTPYWNIRWKSSALPGKGKRKDKSSHARMRIYPNRTNSGTEAPPFHFDLFGGKYNIVNYYIDILGKINNALLRNLGHDGKQCRARNKLEMSQCDRRTCSAEGKNTSTQCSSNKTVSREMEKRSAKPPGELLDKALESLKAKTVFPNTGVAQNEFPAILKNSSKPGYSPTDKGKDLKRNTPTIGPDTNPNLRTTTGKINVGASKKDDIQEIKPTFVEIIKNPTRTATDSLVDKSELGFKSGRSVIRGSNFILLDHKLYFTPRSETRESGFQSHEIDSKKRKMSNSNAPMFDGTNTRHSSGEMQPQGGVIRGSNFIIVNNKSITMTGGGGRGTKDTFTPNINSGPVITNSTDSVANGNKHTFVLVDAVEHNMAKRYGKEKRNFVLDNDNPHNIAKSKDAVGNKNVVKQGPLHTATSTKPDGVPGKSETIAKQIKKDGDTKKQSAVENAPGSYNVNTLSKEMTNHRGSHIEDNVPLTSFESVIKDSQKLIEQIQKDKQNLRKTFNDPMNKTQPIAKAAKNKKMATTTKTKAVEDSEIVQTEVSDNPGPNTLAFEGHKLPKVSVKELKPEIKGNKETENDLTPGNRKKKEEGEPSLYVKPEELGKKTSPQSRELDREKKSDTKKSKPCTEPDKKSKPVGGKTTNFVDFQNWSKMLSERMSNYQNLTSQQRSVGASTLVSSQVSVTTTGTGSESLTKQIVSSPVVSKCPPSSWLDAVQETVHTKTKQNDNVLKKTFVPNNSKHLDDIRKDIQANFSRVFKSKFSEQPKINAHNNSRSDLFTSDHVTKDQTMCSNAKLDVGPMVKNPNQEVKHRTTANTTSSDPTTVRNSNVMVKNKKENEADKTIKLSDRYVLVPASEWAKVRQAFFAEELPQSRDETMKTRGKITPTLDKKGEPSRATEPLNCQTKPAAKSYKSDEVLALKQSQNSQQTSAGSVKRNVLSDNQKSVSNKVDGTTKSPLGTLVVNKFPSQRYASENTVARSKSDTNLGSDMKLKIDTPCGGKVLATKSTSSQPVQLQSITQEVKPLSVPGNCPADETSKSEKFKATVDSTPRKVKSLDGAEFTNFDLQEFQRSPQLQKKMIDSCERDLIKYELALKKYKAMLSIAKKSAVKK